jgi:hypothetical protein
MTFKRKRITKKKEFGIWSFYRETPKSAVKVYARCPGCGKVNDLTGGHFIAVYKDGKCQTGISGCQACRYCSYSFSNSKFERWVARFSFIDSLPGVSQQEVEAILSKHKGEFTTYLMSRTLVLTQKEYPDMHRSAQIVRRDMRWVVAWNVQSSPTSTFNTLEEAVSEAMKHVCPEIAVKGA